MSPRAALAIGFAAGVLASVAAVGFVVTTPMVVRWLLT